MNIINYQLSMSIFISSSAFSYLLKVRVEIIHRDGHQLSIRGQITQFSEFHIEMPKELPVFCIIRYDFRII